jgi:hypothetical protein
LFSSSPRTVWAIVALVVVLIVFALMRFDLTALKDPGRFEKLVSNRLTRFIIRRASHRGIPPRRLDVKGNSDSGGYTL